MDLQIEYISTADLVPYEKNTRKHKDLDVDNIARSIQKYGFNDPIGIWNGNVIIEGHGRLLAAQQLGMEKVPCVRLDHLTDEERREYAIAHNATAELSEWDVPNIEAELEELDLSEFDFDLGLPEEASNVNIDDFFVDAEQKPKEPKKIQCPHCGEWFEV